MIIAESLDLFVVILVSRKNVQVNVDLHRGQTNVVSHVRVLIEAFIESRLKDTRYAYNNYTCIHRIDTLRFS